MLVAEGCVDGESAEGNPTALAEREGFGIWTAGGGTGRGAPVELRCIGIGGGGADTSVVVVVITQLLLLEPMRPAGAKLGNSESSSDTLRPNSLLRRSVKVPRYVDTSTAKSAGSMPV